MGGTAVETREMATKKAQKNFYVEPEFKAAFEAYCEQEGYEEVRVLLAAIRAFVSLPAEDRSVLMDSGGRWHVDNYPELPTTRKETSSRESAEKLLKIAAKLSKKARRNPPRPSA